MPHRCKPDADFLARPVIAEASLNPTPIREFSPFLPSGGRAELLKK